MYKEDPGAYQDFIRNEADQELLKDLELAQRANNIRQYRRLQTKLIKSYNNYLREQERNN